MFSEDWQHAEDDRAELSGDCTHATRVRQTECTGHGGGMARECPLQAARRRFSGCFICGRHVDRAAGSRPVGYGTEWRQGHQATFEVCRPVGRAGGNDT